MLVRIHHPCFCNPRYVNVCCLFLHNCEHNFLLLQNPKQTASCAMYSIQMNITLLFEARYNNRVLAGKPKLSPFLVNWENVFIDSIFFII